MDGKNKFLFLYIKSLRIKIHTYSNGNKIIIMKNAILISLGLSLLVFGCPYGSLVTLNTNTEGDGYYLRGLLGTFCHVDKNNKVFEKYSIEKTSAGSLVCKVYTLENGQLSFNLSFNPRPTRINNYYFIHLESDGEYLPLMYKTTSTGLDIYGINDDFVGNRTFNSSTDFRYFVSQNINNSNLFEYETPLIKESNGDAENISPGQALLLILGAAIVNGLGNNDNGEQPKSKLCTACNGSGRVKVATGPIWINDSANHSTVDCKSCKGTGYCKY